MAVPDNRVLAIHAVTLYEPVCHECGWRGELWTLIADADDEAERHECERKQ